MAPYILGTHSLLFVQPVNYPLGEAAAVPHLQLFIEQIVARLKGDQLPLWLHGIILFIFNDIVLTLRRLFLFYSWHFPLQGFNFYIAK